MNEARDEYLNENDLILVFLHTYTIPFSHTSKQRCVNYTFYSEQTQPFYSSSTGCSLSRQADDRSLRMRGPLLGIMDENGCGGSLPDWCPETRECIAGFAETCPIEDGQTFVGGTELTCVDGRCSTDEVCLYELGTARMGFFYATRVTGPYEVPSGCTLTCTGCEPAVADDSANLRPPRMRGGPNPAAVNCINKGGALETLTQADGGRYGVCLFSDSSACGDWALFRGECAKGDKPFFSAFCADSGGEMSNEDVIFKSYGNAPATYEVCTVNGAQCAAEDYYSTGCVFATKAAKNKAADSLIGLWTGIDHEDGSTIRISISCDTVGEL